MNGAVVGRAPLLGMVGTGHSGHSEASSGLASWTPSQVKTVPATPAGLGCGQSKGPRRMHRLSPSSQLVAFAVAFAVLLSAVVVLTRTDTPTGIADASAGAASAAASMTASSTASSSGSTGPSLSVISSPESSHGPADTPLPTYPATAAPNSTASPSASPTPPAGPRTLAELLSMLATAPEQGTGYERSLFRHWIDSDGDGCDTRREVLIEESLTTVTVSATCGISDGSWTSPYDGVHFTDPSGLDIDHVVALAEAWDSGAFGWTAERRQRFANDLDVSWSLIAVSASSNRSKSDQDPADWLPPSASYLCTYLADWLVVKVRWSLAVDSGERAAINDDISACPNSRRPVVIAP